jgi:hypothetical protein
MERVGDATWKDLGETNHDAGPTHLSPTPTFGEPFDAVQVLSIRDTHLASVLLACVRHLGVLCRVPPSGRTPHSLLSFGRRTTQHS